MNSRWATLVAASLVAFASFGVTWQFRHYDGGEEKPYKEPYPSLAQSFLRGERLAGISNIVDRSQEYLSAAGTSQYFDLVLPKNARVFMMDMTGPTNNFKMVIYHYMTYYLFPREIGVSVDQPTRMTKDGFLGRTAESDQEILANGFDVRVSISSVYKTQVKALRDLPLKFPTNPAWFNSNYDTALAFLLPLLTALAGMWLFRFLFPSLGTQIPLLEQLAYGLGLAMMAVAAFTLGIKLCGFHGRGLILTVTAVGAFAEIWRDRKVLLTKIAANSRKTLRNPITAIFVAIGLLVFLVLFRIAGLEGLVDGDALRWMLKAKIIHLYTGSEIVQWFSNPRLAHAHLDYPTLVPSLHAATYDSLGHADEFVAKFWPVWMLLFLLAALASLNRAGKGWFHAPHFALLGLLLLPAIQRYVQYEGGIMPMIFFTVLGLIQCAFWLVGKDRVRLGLGLTLLFGGAMTHFEGFIFLALVGSWMLLLPSARSSLKPSPRLWRMLAFCFLAALPFVCLRVRIPVLHYESGWAGYALHNPGTTLLNCPWIFMILLARLFVSCDIADWSGEGGRLHWIGRWDGLSSLYNHSTIGLAWLCLLLTAALWFAIPARRRVIVWVLAMLVGSLAAFSMVFASLFNITDLVLLTGYYLLDNIAGRYLLPVLLAWFATILALFFADLPSSTSTLAPCTAVADSPTSASTPDPGRPVSKSGYWLVVGALLIMILGVVLPRKTALPENRLQNAAATNPLDGSKTNSPENADLQARMNLAIQMDEAGKHAEALQEYREAVRLYPNNPGALNNLAWTLAANPNPKLRNGREAVQLASKAVELTGQQKAVFIGTLAAAYAEDGQFAKAVEMANKAREVALLSNQLEMAVIYEQLSKLYSAGKAVDLTNGP
jgi:hypothetical protein